MTHILNRIADAWAALRRPPMDPALAADLGLAATDLAVLATHRADVPRRMARMAGLYGAPLGGMERWRNHEMISACNACACRVQCDKALDSRFPADPDSCGFCPNARHFRHLSGEAG